MISSEERFKKINLAEGHKRVWKKLRSHKARTSIQIRNNKGLFCANRNGDGEWRDDASRIENVELKALPG